MITKKIVQVPLYPSKISIIIYDNIDEVRKYRPNIENYISFCDMHNNGFILLGIESTKDVGMIVHEAEHAKNYVWQHIGYAPQADNDEVDAYLMEWIFKAVTTLYYKHKETKTNTKEDESKSKETK